MSGIAAVVARGGAPADASLLARMIAAQRFRGPDGQGSWLRGSVGLGHTLHRTTLEAEREVSPAALDDRLFVTADARIDARDELRARLRDRGHDVPADAPDPELILHAYDAWGEGCAQHLLGDFSFALWDAPRRKLFCAIDPLGARAFYYADRGGLFVGSNSLAPVRLHAAVRDELCDRAVGDFILLGAYEDRDLTIYADVARVPPGHFLVVPEDGGARLERYFSWPEPGEARFARPDDCVEEFQELLGRAVRDRLRTPKVAVFMSGGVDSPLVAATAKRELARGFATPELRAYCAVYDRLIPDDERRWAGLAAASLAIPIDFQPMDDGALFDWVSRLSPPEPTADGAMGPFLDQLSRLSSHGPVVLTGYDGDTLLTASLRLHWRERLAQGRVGRVAREVAWVVGHTRALPPMGVRTALGHWRRARVPPRRPSWLREELWRRAGLERRWTRALRPPEVTRSRAPSAMRFGGRSWGALFDAYDPGTLGRAIDVRHPLLDLRLVRFALRLPAVPWCVDKYLLRRCLDDLPEALRRRPKTPLAVDPFGEMLRRGGLDAARAVAPSPKLEAFVDPSAMRASLARDPGEDPWPLLRAVALGLWLDGPR